MRDPLDLEEILNEYGGNGCGRDGEARNAAWRVNRGGDRAADRSRDMSVTMKDSGRSTERSREIRSAGQSTEKKIPVSRRQKKRKTGNKKSGKYGTILVSLFFTVLLLLAGGLLVTYSGRILPNVYVGETNLGMLSSAKARQTLIESGWQERTERVLTVKTYGDVTVSVDPVEAGFLLGTEEAVNLALRYGRQGNLFANLLSFLKALGKKTDLNAEETALNTAYIQSRADLCQEKLNEALGELYRLDEEKAQLVLIKGQGSLFLNTAALQERITAALRSGETELEFRELLTDPVSPDMETVRSMVCTGSEDASFSTDGTHTILEGRPGYDFNAAEAQLLWDAADLGETVRIPLTVSYSGVTAEYLESTLYHDLLGAVTTKYNNSGENRRSNVRLAASRIDGTVLFPGEEFSFNDVVGVRSEEAGFLSAPAYAGYNDIKEEIGGGVCQVSSGVYAAALFSFLDITKHTCHVYPPNYIQLGTDATVTIPEGGGRTIDLRFVNSRNWPVKIVAYCEETEDRGDGKPLRTVTVEIWGTLEEEDYMPVEFDNSYIDIYDYDRTIEPAYPDREGYKIKFTHDEQAFEDDNGSGIRTATHRKVYDSKGNLVEDKIINPTYSAGYALDTYYFMQ